MKAVACDELMEFHFHASNWLPSFSNLLRKFVPFYMMFSS